ncbi:6701_t:CDS:1, partial [Dentiscutata heterogama]
IMMENIDYNDSNSKSVDKIKNFFILNFDNDTYQNIKDKILQLDGDDNKDYDLNSEIEEIILYDELDEGFDEIIPNIPKNKDNKYTPCVIIDNDNDNYKIHCCNGIDANQPLAQLK